MVHAEEGVMSLVLRGLRLPLASFTLEIDAVFSGRVTGIFGASGAGKTSLLEIIAGLRRPTAGSVSFGGTVLTDVESRKFLSPQIRHLGYVPQEGALFPHLRVKENLLYGYRKDTARPTGLNFAHVTEVLEITALADRRVASLSGGEKQRVALGRALLAAPRLLLLDEPLAGLDTELKERLMPYLRRVRDEFMIPMVYVTHSTDEVMALCEEILVLEQGRVIRQGRPADLLVRAETPRYQLKP
jgi:molybdate transport system ATP-binding protein